MTASDLDPDTTEHGAADAWHGRLRQLIAWLPGILALIALVIVLLKLGEMERLLAALGSLSPAWIGLAALPQLATYAAAAAVWYVALRRSQHRRHLAGLYLLGVAKLFMDQALPSGGVSGSLFVVAALLLRGLSFWAPMLPGLWLARREIRRAAPMRGMNGFTGKRPTSA